VYDPPESTDGSFSTAGDIWSLGVFMVEALTQCRPSCPDRHSAAAVLPETLPPQFVQIVRRCLSRNPAHRPTVAELEAQINPVPQTSVRQTSMPHAPVLQTPMPHAPVLHTLVSHTLVPQAPVTETAVAMPAMAEMTVGDEALVAETPGEAFAAETPGEAFAAETPGEALVAGTPGAEALVAGAPVAGALAMRTLATARYPVLSPPRFPILRPAEPVDPIPPQLEDEDPELATVVLPVPRRRSFVPAGAAILVVAIMVWIGLRVLGSQAYSILSALPAATAQNPATATAAPLEIPAAPLAESSNARPSDGSTAAPSGMPAAAVDSGFADPQTVVASSSVLHEEAPDVPTSALETIRGHIKFAVRVTVDGSGNVVHATLVNHSPSGYFTRLAIESARKWKFVAADNPASRQWLLRFEFTRDGATAHANNPQTSRTERPYRKTGAAEMRQAKTG